MIRYKYLDTNAFENYFGGIERARAVGLFCRIARGFVDKFDARVSELCLHVRQGERDQARILAHRMKGTLLSLGANPIAAFFLQLETQVKEDSVESVLECIEQKKPEMLQMNTELKAWIKTLEDSIL